MSMKLRAVPSVERFEPRIAVMDEQQEPQAESKYLDANGVLTCPTCKCQEFKTPDSEPWERGFKRRYKSCVGCGLRVRTKEVVDDE